MSDFIENIIWVLQDQYGNYLLENGWFDAKHIAEDYLILTNMSPDKQDAIRVVAVLKGNLKPDTILDREEVEDKKYIRLVGCEPILFECPDCGETLTDYFFQNGTGTCDNCMAPEGRSFF